MSPTPLILTDDDDPAEVGDWALIEWSDVKARALASHHWCRRLACYEGIRESSERQFEPGGKVPAMGRIVTRQYAIGQVHVGEEFTALLDGNPTRVRVVAERSVIRGTDEVDLEVLE